MFLPCWHLERIRTSSRLGWIVVLCPNLSKWLSDHSVVLSVQARHTCRAIAFSEWFMNIIMLFIVSNAGSSDLLLCCGPAALSVLHFMRGHHDDDGELPATRGSPAGHGDLVECLTEHWIQFSCH